MEKTARFLLYRAPHHAPLNEEQEDDMANLQSSSEQHGEHGIGGKRRRPHELGFHFPVDYLGESKREE